MFNWSLTQSQVSKVIQHVGFQMTLIKADNTSAKAYGVWDSNSKYDLATGAAKLTTNQKQMYIQASIKKVPAVGDTIQQGTDLWSITEVEAYKPSSTVLAYRVVCQ